MIQIYSELIKRLRECTAEQNGEKTLWHQAADAIEELQKITAHYEEESKGWWLAACDAKEERERLKEQIPKWIPVTERLPEENGSYLIVNGKTVTKIVAEAYYNKDWGDSCWTDPVEMYMTYHPTHWMPLPSSEGLNET